MNEDQKSLSDWIVELRDAWVCYRCGKYVGGLGVKRYLPPPYPVALAKITAEDEVEALVGFESHMVGRMRKGNFRVSHPQHDGVCVSFREWAEADEDDGEDDEKD